MDEEAKKRMQRTSMMFSTRSYGVESECEICRIYNTSPRAQFPGNASRQNDKFRAERKSDVRGAYEKNLVQVCRKATSFPSLPNLAPLKCNNSGIRDFVAIMTEHVSKLIWEGPT